MSTASWIETEPITSPWVLVDDLTAHHAADLLGRLAHWLDGPDQDTASRCARALSQEENHDPEATSEQVDALAERLRHCTTNSQLTTRGWTIRTN